MVDWDGLENRCAFTGTVGSNPTLSARPHNDAPARAGGSETIPEISAIQPDPGLVPSYRGGLYVCRAIFADNILGTRSWGHAAPVSPAYHRTKAISAPNGLVSVVLRRSGPITPRPVTPRPVTPRNAMPALQGARRRGFHIQGGCIREGSLQEGPDRGINNRNRIKIVQNDLCPQCGSEHIYQDGALWICPECALEWSVTATAPVSEEDEVVRDANGTILSDGDSVTVIKDLKVKGSSSVIKGGTKIKGIRLVDASDGHNLSCKIPGVGGMNLKSEFVRKA